MKRAAIIGRRVFFVETARAPLRWNAWVWREGRYTGLQYRNTRVVFLVKAALLYYN
ncbi:hypothetical protein WBG83_02410 [Paenibacillus sp. y28]